jgi:rhomboid protease GluP
MNIFLSAAIGILAFFIARGKDERNATAALIAINLFAYFLTSDLLEAYKSIIIKWGNSLLNIIPNPATLVTSMFLHANIVHIALNMYALYIFGNILEKGLGSGRFLLIYMASGIFGNLLSLLISYLANSISIGVGASGAILGLFGFIMAYEYRITGKIGFSSIIVALFVLAGGFMPNVDVSAHVGGFVTGLIYGLISMRPERYEVVS